MELVGDLLEDGRFYVVARFIDQVDAYVPHAHGESFHLLRLISVQHSQYFPTRAVSTREIGDTSFLRVRRKYVRENLLLGDELDGPLNLNVMVSGALSWNENVNIRLAWSRLWAVVGIHKQVSIEEGIAARRDIELAARS